MTANSWSAKTFYVLFLYKMHFIFFILQYLDFSQLVYAAKSLQAYDNYVTC